MVPRTHISLELPVETMLPFPTASRAMRNVTFPRQEKWKVLCHWYTYCKLVTDKNLPNISSVTRKLNWAPDQISSSASQSRKGY